MKSYHHNVTGHDYIFLIDNNDLLIYKSEFADSLIFVFAPDDNELEE